MAVIFVVGFFTFHFDSVVFTILLQIEKEKQLNWVAFQSSPQGSYVIPLQVKVSEIQCDPKFWRRNNFPDTVLVGWVMIGKRWTFNGARNRLNQPTASVLTGFSVRVQLVADATFAPIASQGVHTFVVTAMVLAGAFVEFLDEIQREARLLYGRIGDEFDEHSIGRGPHVFGDFVATKFAQQRSGLRVAIPNLQIIVHTIIVPFDLERLEF